MIAPAWIKPDAPVSAAPAIHAFVLVQSPGSEILAVSLDRKRLERELVELSGIRTGVRLEVVPAPLV